MVTEAQICSFLLLDAKAAPNGLALTNLITLLCPPLLIQFHTMILTINAVLQVRTSKNIFFKRIRVLV